MNGESINKAALALNDADAILIGASNGLSIAEGYNIFADNEMFVDQFGDFKNRYGIRNVLEGTFFNYPSLSTRKEFLDRLVKLWVTDYKPTEVMKNLRTIVGDKDYFIVTSNADTHLELSGFNPNKIFEVENTMARLAKGLPVEDKRNALYDFLAKYAGKRIVILELGVGRSNRIIKPFLFEIVHSEPLSVFVAMNMKEEINAPEDTMKPPILLEGDLSISLKELRTELGELTKVG